MIYTPSSRALRLALVSILLPGLAAVAWAAVPDRVTRPVNASQTRVLIGQVHRLAQPQFDRGAVDPDMHMDYLLLVFKPSSVQQAELDRLLADQQNPASPVFRQWLTPETFGDRFGLSSGDHSKVVAWLTAEGFTVNERARGRNWVAFSGTAAQVSRSLRTAIHRFQVGGETHFATIGEPSVPEALADVIGGFIGLDDFLPKPQSKVVQPNYNSGGAHYLAPADFATIYNVAPLYQGGFDGTGQKIAIVGASDIAISDIRAFRSRYNLPANDPVLAPYSTTDPGFNGAEPEGDLDLEWAGAIAPKATIYYVYGPNPFTAAVAVVNANLAPIISISYSSCEVDQSPLYYRSIAQQANAQGITILAASGDAGAAGCDSLASEPLATRGRSVNFPAVMPEVTGVGGTQFAEGSGSYWGSNAANGGSALSYIPEAAWNESDSTGLLSSGGGASLLYARPSWQTGTGVPGDNARHVPDISFSAAGHDAYLVYSEVYQGLVAFEGTSCGTPSLAGVLALLNQYQVSQGYQKKAGLGNINPQLYRLAQSAPSAFHDVTTGDNMVACAQGTPDCLTGSFGFKAGTGYDMATGLGSVDASSLFSQWNSQTSAVSVTLFVEVPKITLNDTFAASALVFPVSGGGTPTGTVSFSVNGIALGTAPVAPNGSVNSADLYFPAYLLGGTGTFTLAAEYSGDAAYSSGGATRAIQVTTPTGAAAIVPSGPTLVWPQPADAQGLSWQTTLSLREVAGVPAMITVFTIDGKVQPLSQYFPSASIPANGTLSTTILFRNLAAPLARTFGFIGIDANGLTWSRQLAVNYFPLPTYDYFNVSATPLTAVQNIAADPSCQWAVQLNVDDLGGYSHLVTGLSAGNVDLSSRIPSIFGTPRLDAFSGLQGTLCFSGLTPPASESIEVDLDDGLSAQVTVSFAGPPAAPVKISTVPATVNLAAAGASKAVPATLAVNISDKTQSWTAAVFPANRTTSWLSLSQLSGIGPAQISLSASGTGFEPGVYRATIVIQSANAIPQYIDVPVMFTLGGSSSTVITGIANAAVPGQTGPVMGSPGMLLTVFGQNLANTTTTATGNPLPFSTAGVSAYVNGLAAPLLYVSPAQLNIQVPYEAGAGPAVLGINNNGQVAGFAFQIAPSAPGIFADAAGNAAPNATVKQGGTVTLLVTGAGDVSNTIPTAWAPTSVSTYKPLLPISVTVGGVPVFVQLAGLSPNQVGVAQVRITLPTPAATGPQPVVVTVGGASSPPVTLTVQ